MRTYLPLLLSWVLFGVVHSVTASKTTRSNSLINKIVPPVYYRLAYNGIALVTFLPVLLILLATPVEGVSDWLGSSWLGSGLIGIGLVIGVVALASYNLAEFIGWPSKATVSTSTTLVQSGLLRYVRHPLYAGILLVATGLFICEPSWRQALFALCAFGYIRIGIYFEERKLVNLFGRAYICYRHEVPMLLPNFR